MTSQVTAEPILTLTDAAAQQLQSRLASLEQGTGLRLSVSEGGCSGFQYSMTFEEKLEVADYLDTMGVDIIEAGFPIASQGDFEAVSEISRRVKNASVCGLSRAGFKDIDRAGEAVKHARRPRIHTFISTSPVHMKHKLNMGANAVLDAVGVSVAHARNLVDDVQWSAEDATRTDRDFLCRCVELAIRSGATTINIPDTVGYATPQEFFELIQMLLNRVPNIDKAAIATHCHNDLGLAVANSLAGVLAGAITPKNAGQEAQCRIVFGHWRQVRRFGKWSPLFHTCLG